MYLLFWTNFPLFIFTCKILLHISLIICKCLYEMLFFIDCDFVFTYCARFIFLCEFYDSLVCWFVLEQKKFISLKSLLTPSLKTSDLILGYNSISKASNYYLYDLDVVLLYILMQTKTCFIIYVWHLLKNRNNVFK